MRIFSEIGKIFPQINGERKRMISEFYFETGVKNDGFTL